MSNLLFSLVEARSADVRLVFDFVNDYFLFVKSNFKETDPQYMSGLEVYIELHRMINQYEQFFDLMTHYTTIVEKVHGLKSAQSMNAFLKLG
jgi:hypothetical protein